MSSSIKWAIYARKSEESEERQVQSLADQIAYLKNLAAQSGFAIAEIIQESKSAKRPYMRSEFSRLLNLIKGGHIDGILCWKLNRLSRNPIDSGEVQWLLQSGKIKCIKTSDRDHRPGDNALLFAVEQGMSNQYSIELSQNVKRGLESKANKGWYPSVPVIGYLNTKSGKKGNEEIIVDPVRFVLVRKMWDLMLSGAYTPMEIWRIATNEWKLDTPQRGKRGRRALAPSHIYELFNNVFYTGSFKYGGKLYQGKHPAMVTVGEFEKVQLLLGKKAITRGSVHEFPYTGVMKCGQCGASITATKKVKKIKATGEMKVYTYYHCTRRIGIDKCTEPPVTSAELENQILNYLKDIAIHPNFLEQAMEIFEMGQDYRDNTSNLERENQAKLIQELEDKLNKLLGYLLNGTISEDEYREQKKILEQKLILEKQRKINDEYSSFEAVQALKGALQFCATSADGIINGDLKTRKSILTHLGSNPRLIDKKLCLTMRKTYLLIKKAEEQTTAELSRFELEKPNNSKAKMGIPENFPFGCPKREYVRIAKTTTHRAVSGLVSEIKRALFAGEEVPPFNDT